MPDDWNLKWKEEFQSVESMDTRWVAGHLNVSAECALSIDHGVRLEFVEGKEYASAGVVLRRALTGDFRADLVFSVQAPAPGATFELAAVTVTPPTRTVLSPKEPQDCSLVFNVHGEPPFVSSEFDEEDGWRISWNEQLPAFQTLASGEVIADTRNNVYGKNSGPKPVGPASGELRLVREGGVHWSAWRRRAADEPWELVGRHNAQAAALKDGVYLRLVGKHWVKHAEHLTVAPMNHIVFHRFSLWRRS
ncbi:MAG: hypothetical protein LCH73_01030 [Proteobacteria bacterium]|nr:hypothetical protein [Pseudomonadota bacterium]